MGCQSHLLIFPVRANCLSSGCAARHAWVERPILPFCLATAQKQTSEQQVEQIVEATAERELGTRKTYDLFRAFAPIRMIAALRAILARRFRPPVGRRMAVVL